MKQNMQDLTEGSLGKKILIFSVPLMLSNLLQVLFNMADIAVIGQFAGSLSLGAVGSTATLVTMFTGFLIGLSGGINVLTALYYGAKDKDSLSKTIHSAALVSLIMGVLLLVLGVGLSEWMLTAQTVVLWQESGRLYPNRALHRHGRCLCRLPAQAGHPQLCQRREAAGFQYRPADL